MMTVGIINNYEIVSSWTSQEESKTIQEPLFLLCLIVLHILFHPPPMHAQGMIIPTFWESVHSGWLSVTCIKRAKKISVPYTFRPTFAKDLPLFYVHNIVCFSVPTQSGQRKFYNWSCWTLLYYDRVAELYYKQTHRCSGSLCSRCCDLGIYNTILSPTVLQPLKSLRYKKIQLWHSCLSAVKV